jgi:DNA-directed RNA polymerase specialized sigma24 family protein
VERNEKILRIKHDLRQLRKITHSIEVSLQVKERHERRLELLRKGKQTPENLDEMSKICKVLSTLHIEDSIQKATELELRYAEAIQSLEPLDRTIILDGYINGKAYWKIGRDIGYTERGIQKRINEAIEKLADLI